MTGVSIEKSKASVFIGLVTYNSQTILADRYFVDSTSEDVENAMTYYGY